MDDTPPTNELIERLTARLSPAGREVERKMRALAPGADTPPAEDAELKARARETAKLADGLSGTDRSLINRIMGLRAQAHGHQAEEHEGMAALMHQAAGVIARAQELESDLGEDTTVEEAIAVLRRHGELSGLSPELADMVVEVPTTAEIAHKSVRVILNRSAAESAPLEVKAEDEATRWAASFYGQAMLIAAAGVLFKTDSLDTAASVLWWANFAVPAGYFPDGHAGEDLDPHDEETLRLWVERERGNILRAVGSQGLYLAGTGRLMEEVEE